MSDQSEQPKDQDDQVPEPIKHSDAERASDEADKTASAESEKDAGSEGEGSES